MHLLNAKSGILHEIRDPELSGDKYAILSHRWEEDEVTFQDLQDPNHVQKLGYRKIRHLRLQAEADGLQWVWIDTCCIDKTSSSELSEAINSMYRWYRDAEVCYIYLSDVSSDPGLNEDPSALENAFRKSLWFTRGWTLQELLAPKQRVFYDTDWLLLGAIGTHGGYMHYTGEVRNDRARYRRGVWKSDYSRLVIDRDMQAKSVDMVDAVHEVTGISLDVLTKRKTLGEIRVADKMSWASKRETSVMEDVAYCLLGIFQVNMPLLYGEGDRAFVRLQKEIIRDTYDHSIFAWGFHGSVYGPDRYTELGDSFNLLARHPCLFSPLEKIYPTENISVAPVPTLKPAGVLFGGKRHYAFTNLGLHIELPLIFLSTKRTRFFSGPYNSLQYALGCFDGPTEQCCVALPLCFEPQTGDDLRVYRCAGSAPFIITNKTMALATPKRKTIYLADRASLSGSIYHKLVTLTVNRDYVWFPSGHFPPTARLICRSKDPTTIVEVDDSTSRVLICYTHWHFGSVLVELTHYTEQELSSGFQNGSWVARLYHEKDHSAGIWETLVRLGKYKKLDTTLLLDPLGGGSSCGFSNLSTGIDYSLTVKGYSNRLSMSWMYKYRDDTSWAECLPTNHSTGSEWPVDSPQHVDEDEDLEDD